LFKIIKDDLKNNKGYRKPIKEETQNFKPQDYTKLDDNGYPIENTKMVKNDIVIGKVKRLDVNEQFGKYIYKDMSIQMKDHECYIDKIFVGQNQEGHTFIKVRTRTDKYPEVADKFATREAQKFTIGLLVSDEDLPFTASGIRPDIIMNPHAIPSRMTMGQIVETLLGKICAIKGTYADATPFNNTDIDDYPKILGSLGFEPYGNETMYCGFTGEKVRTQLFIGPTYCQRLKHLVSEKVHARSIGAVQMTTRQPLEGRSQDGGHRLGEMETWVLTSNGVASFLLERFMNCSDGFDCWIDTESGLIAVGNPDKKIFYGKSTDNYKHIKKIRIPYTYKQFLYECMACCMCPRIVLDNNTI
jgi:DNA-directed RNA polymerase II subunit RPB2